MQKLNFSADRYFAAMVGTVRPESGAYDTNVSLCEEAMNNLIERYHLAGKSVFSLGSGHSFEEFWLHKAGCALTLNDIDLLVSAEDCHGSGLTFYHGDAGDAVEAMDDEQFDIVYGSGFHPDEIRRENIQAEFAPTRSDYDHLNYITWPAHELPYSETMANALAKVKDGGLVIFQHYRGGVCIDYNPHYVEAIRRQFRAAGVQLLEIYTFRRSTAHILVVGFKGSESQARAFGISQRERSELTMFHGRYPDQEISTDVLKAFDMADDTVRPEIVFEIVRVEPPAPAPEPPQPETIFNRVLQRGKRFLKL